MIDKYSIGFVIIDDRPGDSFSEALFEFSDNTHEIDSKILNSFRNEFNRDIIGVSSNNFDTRRSFDFFDIYSESFCDILEILSTFFAI